MQMPKKNNANWDRPCMSCQTSAFDKNDKSQSAAQTPRQGRTWSRHKKRHNRQRPVTLLGAKWKVFGGKDGKIKKCRDICDYII